MKDSVKTDKKTLASCEQQQQEAETKISSMQAELTTMREKLKSLEDEEAVKSQTADSIKKTASKSASSLQKALREIAGWVSSILPDVLKAPAHQLHCQNDDIEKSASERFAIYRRCKLEEIRLPLASGSVDDVPLEEVCHSLESVEDGMNSDSQFHSRAPKTQWRSMKATRLLSR